MLRSFRGAVASAFLLAGVFVGAGCQSSPRTREPANLSHAKAAVIAYHDSGAYLEEVAAVAEEAEQWIRQRADKAQSGERLAVVFDIDETVLSTYPQMRSQDFGYVPKVWSEYVAAAEAKALEPVRDVYHSARAVGVTVFFVTGRKDGPDRDGTARNLAHQGMNDYAELFMAAPGDFRPTWQRKSAARAEIERRGYRIIANIGDQASDLAGGHAERTFKLPNPFYSID